MEYSKPRNRNHILLGIVAFDDIADDCTLINLVIDNVCKNEVVSLLAILHAS
jgi:hypothetical protein